MPLKSEQFTQQLVDSGLMPAGDLQSLLAALPAPRKADGEQIARELVRQKKLTAYQAQQVYQGRGKHLVLGNYVVLDKLGQGGMGMVLKAEHRRMKRLVALKMLSPTVTKTPEALRRFQREVEAAAKLRHTNIVAADDADEAGGTHFLVMEFVEGSDLAAVVREKGPLAVEKAVSCVLQTARGLDYAHNRGVVHRDIKPANLLLDREGTVKILDMGLARLDGAGANQDDLTGTGQIMGTIDYMSPEQALDTKHADARADIYSLGITLWFLLTGRPVYEGNSTMAKLLAHRESAIPSLCQACPSASPALEAVFARMVAKTPGERFQSMSAVIADLEDCQSGQTAAPTLAPAAGEDSRLSEFLRGMNPNAGGTVAGTAAATRTKAAAAAISTQQELQQTVSLSSPEVETDPTTQLTLGMIPRAKKPRKSSVVRSWLERLPIPPRYRLPALIGGGAAAALILLGIILLLQTDVGTVRVEINDPAISATVMGTVLSVQGTGDHSLTVEPGEHGLHVVYGELEFDTTTKFVLADGETVRLKIELLPGRVQVLREDGSVIGEQPLPSIDVATNVPHTWPADAPPPAIAPFDAAQAKAHQAAWAAHLGVPVEYENSIGMKFVLIPPGEFTMGSTQQVIEAAIQVVDESYGGDAYWKEHFRGEAPQHKVILTQPIFLGVHEVTQAQYEQVMAQNPSHFAAAGAGKDTVVGLDTTIHPVETVSWNDAAEFCAKLSEQEKLKPFYLRNGENVTTLEGTGYRLPTEAQWEFACRAGTTAKFWTGDSELSLAEVAWFSANSGNRTHAVAELRANSLGLFDIHGNVWEWVQDWWEPTYYAQFEEQPALNPAGASSNGSQRVLRGGHWYYPGAFCRASTRLTRDSSSRDHTIGFRVALPVEAAKAAIAERTPQPANATATWSGWPTDSPAPAIAPFDAAQAKAHQAAWAAHLGVPVEYENSIGMKFVLIPPGEFLMGSTPEEFEAALVAAGEDEYWKEHIRSEAPQHQVILTQPIYLGVHEVTQVQFEKIIGQNPSHFAATGAGKEAVVGLDTTNHPVEMVSWNDAAEFCAKLSEHEKLKPFNFRSGETAANLEGTGYRLPTEAQWEFACRAGTTTRYWIGDTDETLPAAGWFNANSGGRTHAVGELTANPLGLFDIHGNVWEWVQDWWEPTYYGQFQEKPTLDPGGLASDGVRRVTRGGRWDNIASNCRASDRCGFVPPYRTSHIGFRVALPVDAVKAATNGRLAAAGPAIDLLAKVELPRDSVKSDFYGEWTREGETLVSPDGMKAGRIVVPYQPPPEYELTAVVERLEGADGVLIGVVVDGHPAHVGIDIFQPQISGISSIDGKLAQQNETIFREAVLTDRLPHTIRITVGRRSVRASVDGREVVNWEGDPSRLSMSDDLPNPLNVSFGSGYDRFRFLKLELRPLGDAARPESAAAPWPGWAADSPAPAIAPFDAAQAKAHQAAWAAHLGVPVEHTNSIGMKFVLIPPGEFLMGSTPEEIDAALLVTGNEEDWKARIRGEAPRHRAILTRPVYLGMHEVTQEQYERIAGENRAHFSANGPGKDVVAGLETATFPVENVDWNDAAQFCVKLSEQEKLEPFYTPNGETANAPAGTGYRLPTEAEWEFACRAGTTTKYWIGDGDEQLAQAAWFVDNAQGRTHAAGELRANPFGLFDVHGNVWEWVQDAWEANDYARFQDAPAVDHSGAAAAGAPRIIRGGEWYYDAANCRSAGRYPNDPLTRNLSLGFRVALPVDAVQRAMADATAAARRPAD